jgi:Inhibitor of growth proteins N-terminal histone-binding
MKTSKPPASDLSSSRRAQPLRQTRNNPPRASISGVRPFGPRGSISGGLEEQSIEIFPAITHFADAITALPKELVRHFTLLKEVDAKIFAPEEDLGKLVDAALNAPPLQRPQAIEAQSGHGPTSAPMSTQGSINGSVTNGQVIAANPAPEAVEVYNSANLVYDPGNIQRRQLFQHCAYTMQNMLVSLDEKNHVISTANEALNKQLARIDDCFPYIELEISEEARYGSTTHWAYPENRQPKATTSRREIAAVNNLSAAAQHMAEEAAARSDARKQALLERKKQKNQHLDSDFDDHHDGRHKEKKLHGNTKIRKAAEAASSVGLGITNGAGTNGNPPKRRKLAEKTSAASAGMERSLSSVFGSNGSVTKKAASPRETPGPEGKKRQRATGATNGQTRKRYVLDEQCSESHTDEPSRNNTVTSTAMSPSLASSPIRTTFPESKLAQKSSPPPTNGGRPASSRARQNSTHSIVEKPPAAAATNKANGNGAGTPDLGVAAAVTGRSVPEVKTTMKESANNSKGEHMLEDVEQDKPEMVGGLVVGNRKDSVAKREEPEPNGESMQGIQMQTTIVTTKSGRASKPSTPAIPTFPEPVRSRSQRNTIENASSNKRSHKKGAGAAAQLIAQHNSEVDDTTSNAPDADEDGEIDEDEPTYCYCNSVSYGEMVGCDADGCEREWFHLECVGLKVAPKGNGMCFLLLIDDYSLIDGQRNGIARTARRK